MRSGLFGSLHSALAHVQLCRAVVQPNVGFLRQLAEQESRLFPDELQQKTSNIVQKKSSFCSALFRLTGCTAVELQTALLHLQVPKTCRHLQLLPANPNAGGNTPIGLRVRVEFDGRQDNIESLSQMLQRIEGVKLCQLVHCTANI